MARETPEAKIQKRAVAELRKAFLRHGCDPAPLFHSPNEGKFPPQYRAHLNSMGVSKGQVDLVIVCPPPVQPGVPGVAIELKAPGRRARASQEQWLRWWGAAGFLPYTAVGHRQTASLLVNLGYITADQGDQWIAIAMRESPEAL